MRHFFQLSSHISDMRNKETRDFNLDMSSISY